MEHLEPFFSLKIIFVAILLDISPLCKAKSCLVEISVYDFIDLHSAMGC
jgi:hypothetical protein